MSAHLTFDTFKPLIGQAFHLNEQDYSETFTLTAAESGRSVAGTGLPPSFILFFNGENPTVMLSQYSYNLENAALGRIEIFLSCIGRQADGTFRYQAVFG